MGFKCVYWGLGEKFFLKYRIRIMFQHPFAEAGCNLNPSGNQSIKKRYKNQAFQMQINCCLHISPNTIMSWSVP